MATRHRDAFVKQWLLVEALQKTRHGLTADQLAKRIGVSRATFYRYIKILKTAGVPIQTSVVNGETRYLITGHDLPPLRPTVTQLMALRLVRAAMTPLAGTAAFQELDKLLAGYAAATGDEIHITVRRSSPSGPDNVQVIDSAIYNKKRIRIQYRGIKDASPKWRTVDPMTLRLVRDQLYLVAFDLERKDWRVFKILRIAKVDLLQERVVRHPGYDDDKLFGRSVKTWIGDEVEVAVRLSSQVARLASEYPLTPDQIVEDQLDGSVIVRSRVAGIVETSRWVLGWGKEAAALEPAELRKAVFDELKGALEGHLAAGLKIARSKQPVSHDLRMQAGK